MELLTSIVITIHIVVSILIIVAVLLQPGTSGDLGSIFGGTTQSIFGATGAVPFLAKLTWVLAAFFLVTSLALGYLSSREYKSSVLEGAVPPPAQTAPAVPGAAPAAAGVGEGAAQRSSSEVDGGAEAAGVAVEKDGEKSSDAGRDAPREGSSGGGRESPQ